MPRGPSFIIQRLLTSCAILQIDPKLIDTSVFGNVAQTSTDAAYLARHVALRSGAPVESLALTVNRLCGSGFQAVVSAAFELQNGEAKVALVGGEKKLNCSLLMKNACIFVVLISMSSVQALKA